MTLTQPAPAAPPRAPAVRGRLLLAALAAAPAVVLRLSGAEPGPVVGLLVFGLGVLAAAVLLMWAAETARADISGALALALLAFIAVLPEYAVDLYFAYTGGSDPANAAYAAANMTGANRLLIGVGWPLVALAGYLAARRSRARPALASTTLGPHRRVDIGFLAVAAVFAFVLPLTRQIAWYVPLLIIPWYGFYLWRVARSGPGDDEEFTGVPARLARLPRRGRRLTTTALFVAAAAVIFTAAEPFATSLISAGSSLGVDRFLLVQWVAPLATEAPELIVAVVFAWRLRADDGLGALLSSKVNQWTLLVGLLPVAYLIGGGGFGMPLVGRQVDEVALTAAQTVLAVVILLDLRFRLWEAATLFGLFVAQFLLPAESARLVLTYVYLGLAAALLVPRLRHVAPSLRAIGGR
ncbi:sodium:proton exchanger [Streptomyces spectabilis]|uniref:Sodium:proton exchanger n=1 Tax=Streptomyces spectabilis TaxID=68270 RepID=A0A516R264_STRST|nr:sodium:proton exchanger [Streptomyces spectabilis]QDQ09747.1 sodium:proton exchanger [Streptomyces spectabilis]